MNKIVKIFMATVYSEVCSKDPPAQDGTIISY
jgi:hypothetical protein